MANLLADASILSQQVIAAGLGPRAATSLYAASQITSIQPGQIAKVGTNAAFSILSGQPPAQALSGALSSLTGVGFTGLFGFAGPQGSKPVALHTEHAGSSAVGDTPYSFTEDIEFFLLRADQSAPSSSSPLQNAKAPATLQSGNFLGKALNSPLGQLATGLAINAALAGVQRVAGKNTLVAPLTGLALTAGLRAATGTGIFSRPAAQLSGGSVSSVSNAVGTGLTVASGLSQQYSAPSAKYFTSLAASSFQYSTASSVSLGAFTAGTVSALGTNFGKALPSITSNSKLAFSLNSGEASPVSWASLSGLNLGLGSLNGAASLNENASSIQGRDSTSDIPKSWYFITSPQDVSWSKEGKTSTAETYGTNTPYVLYGSTSLRKLTLSNTMLEGFSNRKTVEANIVALETCMNMVIQKGYTAPYCWKVYSGGKNYGTFVITSVKVKEVMRDTRGYATRAFVDIELLQVPNYQVNSGRDLASKAALGGLSKEVQAMIAQQNKDPAVKTTERTAGQQGRTAASRGAAGTQDAAAAQAKTDGPQGAPSPTAAPSTTAPLPYNP